MTGQREIPTATYRLQFNRTFTFRDAAAIVPYLSELGISHVYASPYLRARPGSLHGYDIIDHNALNPEIGTEEDYEHFVSELHRHGMGQILDIVPNHMGVMGSDNAWWLDVLENGEASDFASFFDIDWDPIKDELQGKVLIPILADQYGDELEAGKLKLGFDGERGEFSLFYFQHRFPIDPRAYPSILEFDLERLKKSLGETDSEVLELQSIATGFGHLPVRRGLNAEEQALRNREKEVQKRRLAALCARSTAMKAFIEDNIKRLNGTPGEPRSFDPLHDLIKAQVGRLAQWRVAADDINYRRFFDINDLAALRMENEAVFENTHRFILKLVAEGRLDGVRIDHPDGLYDPAEYLTRLTQGLAESRRGNTTAYVVVEKILTGNERLRKEWPIDGTTGYEFANLVNGLFVDANAGEKMSRIYRAFAGDMPEYSDLVYRCKKLIVEVGLASELNVLANLLSRIALANRHTCDFTLNSLRSALAEIIASFPVYRTYVTGHEVSEEDRRYVEQAVAVGRRRSDAADLSVFDFVRRVLLIENNGEEAEWYRRAVRRFAMKFQQVTSAVMAKGLEDTAFYRYNRLVSLNDVGGNPNRFGSSVEEFHRANGERRESWPNAMLASSTHDSKRSADVRARINGLSEIPGEWTRHLRRWRDWNRGKKRLLDGAPAPTRNDEYLLYQTLVGAWPAEPVDEIGWKQFAERIEQYMLKAVREAKEHTSWANTNAEYEAALAEFVKAILERGDRHAKPRNRFLADFEDFARRVARVGIFNSLSATVLKMTSPGVPDTYQGGELFEFSLVDPDNRRPVDYARGMRLLEEARRFSSGRSLNEVSLQRLRELVTGAPDAAKLFLSWKMLNLRKEYAALFQQGSYIPLKVSGEKSEHVVAFGREFEGRAVIVVAPRLCGTLLGDRETICDEDLWRDTAIEIASSDARCYHNIFTGECHQSSNDGAQSMRVAALLRYFPVAILVSQSSGDAE
jgi:(1->4)-alpha-D-glucan 1-alpha-D-glucosylmutase